MIETLEQWIAWAESRGVLTAMLVGSFAGWLLTLALERYFLPLVRDEQAKRRQQGLTFLFCWLTCGTCMALMWWALDRETDASIRLIVSYISAILPWFLYPILARKATKHVPEIGSAWMKREGD